MKGTTMYRHFTQEERYEIYEKRRENVSIPEIASMLGRGPSSVYRAIE